MRTLVMAIMLAGCGHTGNIASGLTLTTGGLFLAGYSTGKALEVQDDAPRNRIVGLSVLAGVGVLVMGGGLALVIRELTAPRVRRDENGMPVQGPER